MWACRYSAVSIGVIINLLSPTSRISNEKNTAEHNEYCAQSFCILFAMNINKLLHSPNVAGQSVVDRVTAAKHSLAGERLAKFVCKATTEEQIPPKKKHIDREFNCRR